MSKPDELTEKELARFARAAERAAEHWPLIEPNDLLRLVAEVRRLRELVRTLTPVAPGRED